MINKSANHGDSGRALKALEIIKEVALAVSSWRNIAAQFGLSKKEIDSMGSAFELKDLKKALNKLN